MALWRLLRGFGTVVSVRDLRLVLASVSPRRRDLLASLGWSFEQVAPQYQEEVLPGESPEQMVLRLALGKAKSVASAFEGRWIIGSDTVVAVDGQVLGKPENDAQALDMLRRLQGRTHHVFSGLALLGPDFEAAALDFSAVTFYPASDEELRAYIATGEGRDKAGSYALQGRGALLVQSLMGHPSTVVGLPLTVLSQLLSQAGLDRSAQWRM